MVNFAEACGCDELRDELARLLDDELVRWECWISILHVSIQGGTFLSSFRALVRLWVRLLSEVRARTSQKVLRDAESAQNAELAIHRLV